NKTLLGGGGVDGAIHRAAGPMLQKECASLHGCETGEAKITCGYGLPAKYVIHTVGPIAQKGVGEVEKKALRSCYKNSLEVAAKNGARSVAFPCISTGIYGYPPEQAVHEALATVREYLDEHDDEVFLPFLFSIFLPLSNHCDVSPPREAVVDVIVRTGVSRVSVAILLTDAVSHTELNKLTLSVTCLTVEDYSQQDLNG
ncbi:O-acetyl-ADP-ribose deacetylase MACROD2, partial [Larimichthys crocea]